MTHADVQEHKTEMHARVFMSCAAYAQNLMDVTDYHVYVYVYALTNSGQCNYTYPLMIIIIGELIMSIT